MLPILTSALLVVLVTAAVIRSRRRARNVPELNRHPERLEQMLDSTDDA